MGKNNRARVAATSGFWFDANPKRCGKGRKHYISNEHLIF
jgi:hypothetical protein